jgi:hypothetical protein
MDKMRRASWKNTDKFITMLAASEAILLSQTAAHMRLRWLSLARHQRAKVQILPSKSFVIFQSAC